MEPILIKILSKRGIENKLFILKLLTLLFTLLFIIALEAVTIANRCINTITYIKK